MTSRANEPAFLQRLRHAVEKSGLTVERFSSEKPQEDFLVRAELAQATLDCLRRDHPQTGSRLEAELKNMGSADECALLSEGRGYTYFHLVHFLFEFGKHHSGDDDLESRVGLAGGGLQEESNPELMALILLLNSALPQGQDAGHLPRLIQTLGELLLDQLFPSGAFGLHTQPAGENELFLRLEWADTKAVRRYLAAWGLEEDLEAFGLNSARQIEGTLRVGLHKMVHHAHEHTRVARQFGSPPDNGDLAWLLSWTPDIELCRLHQAEQVLEQGRVINRSHNRHALEYFQERVKSLESRLSAIESEMRFQHLVGSGQKMRRVFDFIDQVAATDLTVLIRGESGTGKELVARAIHDNSDRCHQPFIAVNCAAFTETLLESELFGHEKGAFTGATDTKPGRFELAQGGTLFLDEAGDIPPTTQVKLLRALENRTFERVGGTRTIEADVRFVAATNQDLEELIDQGRFRQDFYFRLNVLPLQLPSLRQHTEDIPHLAHHFVDRIAQRSGKQIGGLTRGAIRCLAAYPWPGNIRELQNVIERAAAIYARGPNLSEADITQALGLEKAPGPLAGHTLNLRQRHILADLDAQNMPCRVDTLAARLAPDLGAGRSLRTLQNDLRQLDRMGHVNWIKHGSARLYAITDQGRGCLQS
jgi:DNA-binding NtrC family response regulator